MKVLIPCLILFCGFVIFRIVDSNTRKDPSSSLARDKARVDEVIAIQQEAVIAKQNLDRWMDTLASLKVDAIRRSSAGTSHKHLRKHTAAQDTAFLGDLENIESPEGSVLFINRHGGTVPDTIHVGSGNVIWNDGYWFYAVMINGSQLLHINGKTGDLFYNPRLLLKSNAYPDGLVYWGNILKYDSTQSK